MFTRDLYIITRVHNVFQSSRTPWRITLCRRQYTYVFFLRVYRMIIYYYTRFVTRFSIDAVEEYTGNTRYSVQSYLYWMPDLKCVSIRRVLTQTCKWHTGGLRFEK